jgi:putative ABC transport system substrate-binding protein
LPGEVIAMKRREFITLLGGAATWPLAAGAQQPGHVPRIGVLMGYSENDPNAQERVAALRAGLAQLGWTDGHNIQIDYRYAAGKVELFRAYAKELVGLAPDAIVADTTASANACLGETRTIPIVFVSVTDPVENGYVTNLARPGGNISGFTNFEFAMSGKWLELLREVSPQIARVGVIFNPETAAGGGSFFLRSIKAAAPSSALEIIPAPVKNDPDIERAIAEIANEPGGALITTLDAFTAVHRNPIISYAASHRLPAVYPLRHYAAAGGLIAYGVDAPDLHRRAASYVDRIIRGAKVGDLPVQQPTKLEFVLNLKTAKALGIDIPPKMLALADEVIE